MALSAHAVVKEGASPLDEDEFAAIYAKNYRPLAREPGPGDAYPLAVELSGKD